MSPHGDRAGAGRNLAALVLSALIALAHGGEDRSVWEGVYTSEQAAAGAEVFSQACLACHSNAPGGAGGHGPAPSLIGEDFEFRWIDSSVADLLDVTRQTMPEAAPNSLSTQQYMQLVAYILQLNGYPAGEAALDPAARSELMRIYIEPAP
ncbi:MAG: cytochrome c [Pseudomonadota bacterium]